MHPKLLNIILTCMFPLMIGGCCMIFPSEERIALVEGNSVEADIETRHFKPYALLIAFPEGAGLQDFHGVITLRNPSQQFSWNISSRNATECNWIKGHDAYILNWKESNQLNDFLIRNDTCRMSAKFSVRPKQASLWISSLRGVGLCIPQAEQGGGDNSATLRASP